MSSFSINPHYQFQKHWLLTNYTNLFQDRWICLQSKIMIRKVWEFSQWVITTTWLQEILQSLHRDVLTFSIYVQNTTGRTATKKHFVLIYETLRGWGGHTSVMQRENWVHRRQADKFPWTCIHNISWEVSWVTLVAWWKRTRRVPSIQASVFSERLYIDHLVLML